MGSASQSNWWVRKEIQVQQLSEDQVQETSHDDSVAGIQQRKSLGLD